MSPTTLPGLEVLEDCQHCSAPVRTARFGAVRDVPLDAAPSRYGCVMLLDSSPATDIPAAVLLSAPSAEAARREGRPTFLPHDATCSASRTRRPAPAPSHTGDQPLPLFELPGVRA